MYFAYGGCLEEVLTILADDNVMGADASVGEEAAKEAVLANERDELFTKLQDVLKADHSSAQLAAKFPGALPLCMSQDQLQQALEMYVDAHLLPQDISAFAASLRHQLLAAANIRWDPLRPEVTFSAIPAHLHMVERSEQIVATLRNILKWEVCHLVSASCHA